MLIKWMSVGCPYAFFSLPAGEGRGGVCREGPLDIRDVFFSLPAGEGRGGVCREYPYLFIRQKCPHKAHNVGIQRYAPDAQAN